MPSAPGKLGLSIALTLGLATGCAAFPDMNQLGPTLEAAVPLRHGEKVAIVEPFAIIRPLEMGLTYLEVDPSLHQTRGAWFSVNGGPWVTSATVRRGDRLEIAYTRTVDGGADASVFSYEIYGQSTKGYVRLVEHRFFADGYPAQRRSLRVLPYEIQRQAAAL